MRNYWYHDNLPYCSISYLRHDISSTVLHIFFCLILSFQFVCSVCCVACSDVSFAQIGIINYQLDLWGPIHIGMLLAPRRNYLCGFQWIQRGLNVRKTHMSMEQPLCNLYSGVTYNPAYKVGYELPGVSLLAYCWVCIPCSRPSPSFTWSDY